MSDPNSGSVPADLRLNCPKDGGPMEKIKAGGVILDRCVRCRAIWFDQSELDRVLATKNAVKKVDRPSKHGRAGEPKVFAPGGHSCPRDGSPLIEMSDLKQPHVVFLSCTVCGGALLDAGELTDLSEFTLRERLRGFLGAIA
jgi:Zn-finger nucleic acid-binding protein